MTSWGLLETVFEVACAVNLTVAAFAYPNQTNWLLWAIAMKLGAIKAKMHQDPK